MQFSIKQAVLAAALAQVGGIAARNSAGVQIVGNIYLSLEGNELTLMATDMEVYARATIEVEGKSDGQTTVNAAKLQALVKAMPSDGNVQFKIGAKENVQLTCGKSRFKLNTLPAKDFPEPKGEGEETHSSVTLPATMLAALLDKVQRAMGNNDPRHFLNGVLVELSETKLRLVSTDGHRLSLAEKDLDHDQKPIGVILPRKGALEFLKLLKAASGDVRLSLSKANLVLAAESTQISSQAIDGRFPDYNAVLPAPVDKPAIVDRAGLASCVERVGITAPEKSHCVRVDLKPGRMELSTNTNAQGSGQDSLDAEFDGAEIKIGFNLTYVRDALAAISSDTVEVHVKSSDGAALILPNDESDHSKHVVMPLKV